MNRIYYSINEPAAKIANDMMSFNDYKEGSKTKEYQKYVDHAFELAEKAAEVKPDQTEKLYDMATRYSKKMAEYINKDIYIGTMCPSIMISGAGNFPVRKKEKQNQAWEKNYKFFKEIQSILSKIENIMYDKEQIKSGDPDAIKKLEEKLEKLKIIQERMKETNKAIRFKDIEKGNMILKEMGYTDTQIKELREPDFCGRKGYPSYSLQNNNANIHMIEERIKNLKATKERGTLQRENKFFRIVENTEIMRLQLFFETKPELEVREVLKSNGFRWSPKNICWQRQLTSNARYSLKKVIEQLETTV